MIDLKDLVVRCSNCGVRAIPKLEHWNDDKRLILRCEACKCELTYNEKKGKWE